MERVRLEDICTTTTSNLTLKELGKNNGAYPVYGASGLIKYIDFYNQDKEYIGIVKDGAGIGRVMLLPKNSSILGTMQYIFPNENIDIKYLYFNLIKMNLKKYYSGSTIPHIYFKDYKKEKIKLYSFEKQKKIAKILENISNIIEKKKQKLQEYELLSKCLFIKMFGDPILNEKKFKKGKIRDTIVEAKYGTSKPATIGGKYPYLRMNNITYNGELDLSDLKYITLEKNEEEKYLVEKGDILFNRTNSKELVGKTCVFNLNTPMVIAGYLIKLKVNKQVIPEYISAFLNSVHGKRRLHEMCRNIIGQANINAQELQDISILIPPIELQNQFAERVKMIEKSKFLLLNFLKI